MKRIGNGSSETDPQVAAQLLAAKIVSELSIGTPDLAPLLSNGCFSEVSADTIHGCEHDYALAMKSYATVYENFQAYLQPANTLATHDYDLAMQPIVEHQHLGCLDQEFIASTAPSDVISDEDIENCGYLGWLRH